MFTANLSIETTSSLGLEVKQIYVQTIMGKLLLATAPMDAKDEDLIQLIIQHTMNNDLMNTYQKLDAFVHAAINKGFIPTEIINGKLIRKVIHDEWVEFLSVDICTMQYENCIVSIYQA